MIDSLSRLSHLHFGMTGVALAHSNLRFAWQAWRLWHWAGSGGALGQRGTWRHGRSICVAGVATFGTAGPGGSGPRWKHLHRLVASLHNLSHT